MTTEFEWCEGEKFDEIHDLMLFLDEGNVIGVRLCSRFPGWEIHAQNGYLVFDVGTETRSYTQSTFGKENTDIRL